MKPIPQTIKTNRQPDLSSAGGDPLGFSSAWFTSMGLVGAGVNGGASTDLVRAGRLLESVSLWVVLYYRTRVLVWGIS